MNCAKPRKGYWLTDGKRSMPAPCCCWNCNACARYKARKVAQRLALIQPTYLLTLTALPDAGKPTAENARQMQAGYRSLKRNLDRNYAVRAAGWAREISPEKGEGRAEATEGHRSHRHVVLNTAKRIDYAKAQAAAKRTRKLGTLDFQKVQYNGFRSPQIRDGGKFVALAQYLAKDLAQYLAKDLAVEVEALPGRRFGISPHYTLDRNLDWYLTTVDPASSVGSWEEADNYDFAAHMATLERQPRAPS